MITCPECMRTFPLVLSEAGRAIRQTGCVHCSSLIHSQLFTWRSRLHAGFSSGSRCESTNVSKRVRFPVAKV